MKLNELHILIAHQSKYILLFIMTVFYCTSLLAQNGNKAAFIKLSEDDDYLNFRGDGTDRGYTSGFKLELYYTRKTTPRFPGNLLMKVSGNTENLYGWGIAQNIYTPNKIDKADIQYGDRPYCGLTYLSHMLISSDKEKKQKLTTTLSLGLIGKYSFAEQLQSWLHRVINYQQPKGWNHQITTDVIINYGILYEHLLFSPTSNLEIIGNISGNAGTLYNNMGGGLQFRIGLFNNYFTNYAYPAFKPAIENNHLRKFQFFFFMKTQGTVVMDDATLQGGFFSHKSSPYVISKDSVNRVFMEYEFGFVIAKKRFGFTASEKLRTPEFKETYAQQVGNISFYYGF